MTSLFDILSFKYTRFLLHERKFEKLHHQVLFKIVFIYFVFNLVKYRNEKSITQNFSSFFA